MHVKFSVLGCFFFSATLCSMLKSVKAYCSQAFTEFQACSKYIIRFRSVAQAKVLSDRSQVLLTRRRVWADVMALFSVSAVALTHPFSFSLCLFFTLSLFLSLIYTNSCPYAYQPASLQQQQKVLSGLKEGAVGFVIIPVWARTDS